ESRPTGLGVPRADLSRVHSREQHPPEADLVDDPHAAPVHGRHLDVGRLHGAREAFRKGRGLRHRNGALDVRLLPDARFRLRAMRRKPRGWRRHARRSRWNARRNEPVRRRSGAGWLRRSACRWLRWSAARRAAWWWLRWSAWWNAARWWLRRSARRNAARWW